MKTQQSTYAVTAVSGSVPGTAATAAFWRRACWAIIAIFMVTASSCAIHEEVRSARLRHADLLFVAAGQSGFSRAIIEATGAPNSNYDHVAIVDIDGDSIFVIEASPRYGVVRRPLSEFVADAEGPVVAMTITGDYPREKAVQRARKHLGQPYDWHFKLDNGMMYCSELVADSYVDHANMPIFDQKPMNFLDNDGHLPRFWTELFDSLGVDVPQDQLGSNPNDLVRSPSLKFNFYVVKPQ